MMNTNTLPASWTKYACTSCSKPIASLGANQIALCASCADPIVTTTCTICEKRKTAHDSGTCAKCRINALMRAA